ncbi:response regulator [Dyadobacter sp. CY323]|uniref:response regulator n=1 Tax=Dyadobacter sp. CY323 TaxID=2907302 RepID=UPI001F451AF4|nr:response regulator [Dyadobacter sp. CY323]MCE6992957.1 response regulator [Dyadobacter sp. CY323]
MPSYKTIFLVDDDEDDRMLVREALVKTVNPIRLVDVERSDDLFPFLDRAPMGPKLILMDMNMPRINGLEMLAKLKGDPRYEHIPVIMISTTTNSALITQAYSLGVNAFIVKPVSYEEYDQLARGVALCFLNNYRWQATAPVSDFDDSKTIIVVEDSDDHWFLLQTAIRNSSMKYQLVRLNTKERATLFAKDELPGFVPAVDMILVDLYLPKREDGLQLLANLRKSMHDHHLQNIPIVIFTYSDSSRDVDDCYRGQANAYLVKPLDVTGWRFYFENLIQFWSKAVKPPRFTRSAQGKIPEKRVGR